MQIKHLFPPDKIHELPTWRFVLHFDVPSPIDPTALTVAVENLKSAEWTLITFPDGLDSIAYNQETQSIDILFEVPPEKRNQPGSLQAYETDFWKICGNVAAAGFDCDIYYQAVDWNET